MNEAAIELRLRSLVFDDALFEFVSTSSDMQLSERQLAEKMEILELKGHPGYYLRIRYTIAQICAKAAELVLLRATPAS